MFRATKYAKEKRKKYPARLFPQSPKYIQISHSQHSQDPKILQIKNKKTQMTQVQEESIIKEVLKT